MDRSTWERQKELLWATFFIVVGIFIFISLFFYNPTHSPILTFPPESYSKNYVGKAGIILATYLFLGLGIVAFVLPFVLIWTGINKVRGRLRQNFLVWGIGLICFFVALPSLIYLAGLGLDAPWYGGGLVGFLFSRVFLNLLGKLGSFILCGALIFICFLLNIDFSMAKRKREISRKFLSQKVPLSRVPASGKPKKNKREVIRVSSSYQFPPLELLELPPSGKSSSNEVMEAGKKLEQTLKDFGIEVQIEEIKEGPAVTRYEVRLAPGIRVSRLINLSSDLALSLAVPNVRIEVPVSGKPLVGIEVPKKKVNFVYLRQLLEEPEFRKRKEKLLFPLGKDIAGETVWVDLENLPHLLIGGSTGSGKSVCLNSILVSLLYKVLPEEVKFLLIDPKTVELVDYADISHLIFPPIKDFKTANTALEWVVQEMMSRYEKFNREGVRNIAGFNQNRKEDEIMPYLIVVIDELADLMMLAGQRLEKTLCRIAQLGRATGIHLIVATQRPSVDVITGLIKANFPSRISFAVASHIDSRTILDTTGAEKLIGKGDMLYSPIDASKPFRVQGSYISPAEVKRVVDFIREQKKPVYKDIVKEMEQVEENDDERQIQDDLYREAKELVLVSGKASTSYLQRKLAIGYNRAARIMEQLEKDGIVGPPRGSKPREVLIEKGSIQTDRKIKKDEHSQ